MDDRTDLAWYRIEKKYGPDPAAIEQDKWEIIEDDHFPECPTAIAARQKRISTLCLCKEIELADKLAREEDEEKWDRKLEKGE